MPVSEWSGVVHTTAQKYLKGAQDNTIRERLLLSMLKKRGRIKLSRGGRELNWKVEYLQVPVEQYGDGASLDFTRTDKWQELVVNWRGYKATDAMTTKEKLMNKGTEQIINRYAEIMPGLEKAITDKFGTELYVDGYATGNDNRLCGLESFCANSTTVAGDIIAKPGDTYAGASTAVAQSGRWSALLSTKPNASIATDWPHGEGSTDYDWNSPKLPNWSSNAWGTGSTTWESNAERCVRQTISWLTLTSGKAGMPTLFLFAGNLYVGFLNAIQSRSRIVVPYKEAQDLGFDGTINYDGVAIATEFGIAANTGYGLNLNEMTLESLSDQLFISEGPEYDIRTDSWLFSIGFFGNCTFRAKAFAKLYNYA